jgi:hypothetical protein
MTAGTMSTPASTCSCPEAPIAREAGMATDMPARAHKGRATKKRPIWLSGGEESGCCMPQDGVTLRSARVGARWPGPTTSANGKRRGSDI